ncbi:MAG: protein kinase [Acidobacteria bacterium]|jgi:tetratricopeptide (TPR) repeat protein|nr:protein kinase [Acidobacteriota bacterium]
MGEVFLARDTRLDRPVAIKAVHPDLLARPDVRARFVREARIAASIVNPFVATVFDVLEQEDRTFLVMEYLEGRSLADAERDGSVGIDQRLAWCAELADALRAVHEHGLVHRDVKPTNVIVTSSGHVKLLDFGLARAASVSPVPDSTAATADESLTHHGAVVGTIAYMSPEQLRAQELGPASDLFSLAVVGFELTTGVHPFRRETQAETISAILSEPPAEREASRTFDSTPGLRAVLERGLRKRPEERYASAEELAEDLRRVQRGEWTRARGAADALRRRRLALVLAIVTVPTLAGAAAGWQWLRTPPRRDEPRVAIAVAALEDRTGEPDGAVRATMVADLISTDLSASRLARVRGPAQLAEVLGRSRVRLDPVSARRFAQTLGLDYLLTGTLYRDGARYVATLESVPAEGRVELAAVRAEAGDALELAERLSSQLRAMLPGVGRLTAWRDDQVDLAGLTSDSEEARLLFERGQAAMRDGKLNEAIARLEAAVQADAGFAMAYGRLAEAFDEAGYGSKARDAATRAMELAPGADTPEGERQALTLKAIWARTFGRTSEAVDATAALVERFPDEANLLRLHAGALADAGRLPESVATLQRAIEREPADPSLHLARAETLILADQPLRAAAELDAAERLYGQLDSAEGLAATTFTRGQVAVMSADFGAAGPAFASAADQFERAGRTVGATRAEMEFAANELRLGRPREADRALQKAEATARATGHLALLNEVLLRRGVQAYLQSDFGQAERLMRESLDLARQLQDEPLMLDPLVNLGSLFQYTGRAADAGPMLAEALDLARKLDRPDMAVTSAAMLADLRYQAGEIEAAIQLYREVTGDAPPEKASQAAGWGWAGLAEIFERQGRLAEALDSATRAAAVFDARALPAYVAYANLRRAQLLAALGRDGEAQDEIEAAHRAARKARGLADLEARVELARGIASAYAGRWDDARRAARRVQSMPGGSVAMLRILALELEAEAALRRGRKSEARQACDAALALNGAPRPDRVDTVALRAEVLAASGDHAAAAAAAREAFTEAERMELRLATARAAAVLVAERAGNESERAVWRQRGLAALDAYEAGAPPESRERVAARVDLQRMRAALGGGSAAAENQGRGP